LGIVWAELGAENAAGVPRLSVPVPRSGSNKQRNMEQRVEMSSEIEFEAPVSLPIPPLGHSCHFGLGLFVPVAPAANHR